MLTDDYPIAKCESGDWGDRYPAVRVKEHPSLDGKVEVEAYMGDYLVLDWLGQYVPLLLMFIIGVFYYCEPSRASIEPSTEGGTPFHVSGVNISNPPQHVAKVLPFSDSRGFLLAYRCVASEADGVRSASSQGLVNRYITNFSFVWPLQSSTQAECHWWFNRYIANAKFTLAL